MSNVINEFYEFGNFHVDLPRRLLLKDGEVVPLTPKAFETLLVLAGSGGRVVDKEELMRRVWAGTVVEEVGVAKNVSALRKAFGESPDEHRYIVTIPGRGYRFVPKVRTVAGSEPDSGLSSPEDAVIETHNVSRTTSEEELADTSGLQNHAREQVVREPASAGAGGQRRPALRQVLGIALLVAGVAAGGLFWKLRSRPVLTEQDTVVLADFTNLTGDPAFDDALTQGLAVQLEQSPYLSIFPDGRVQQTLRLMGVHPGQRVTPELARQICERQGLKALIAGWIAPLGAHFAITLEAIDGHSGDVLARTQVEAERKEQVLTDLSRTASQLRAKLGESLKSIQKYDALLEATTPSLEALRAYSLGNRETRQGKWRGATVFYYRAVELDPNFAYAYATLAATYRNLHEHIPAAEAASKAYALKDRASEREKLMIVSGYYQNVTGELDKQIESLKLLRQIYPRDSGACNSLALALRLTGQFEQAIEESRAAMRLDSGYASRYANLGGGLIRVNQFQEADQVLRTAVNRKLEDMAIHHELFRLAFLHQDGAALEHELAWAADQNEPEASRWQTERAGALGEARKMLDYARQVSDAAIKSGAAEVATSAAQTALSSAALGRCEQAHSLTERTVDTGTSAEPLARTSLALAVCRETNQARRLADKLTHEYPTYTIVNGIWLPAIRAAMALADGDPASAVQRLGPSLRYEAAAYFWPQYLRGEAYLQLRKSREAEAEFRKIRDHQGQDVLSPLYPLAQLGIARAKAMEHDSGARKAYEQFIAEWGQADSDLPMLTQAKAELDRLQ